MAMNITFNSRNTLHLSVAPTVKSWSILFGIISVGVGAAYYSPDEHPLLKLGYLTGCLILGLTFLDDWEDCVIDQFEQKITLTRRNWFEFLTSQCPPSKTLVLNTNSVMAVKVFPVKKNKYQTGLLLRSGAVVPISETAGSIKSEEEVIGNCVRRILCLERIETVRETFDDSDDDNQSDITVPDVESLDRSSFIIYDDLKVEGENEAQRRINLNEHLINDEDSDNLSSSSTDAEYYDE